MRHRSLPIFLTMVLAIAACSSDGAEPDADPGVDQQQTSQSTSAPTDTQSNNGGGNTQGLPSGGDGTYVIDGESFDATVYRCEPFTSPGQEPDDRELSVLAYRGGSEGLEVEIGIGTGFGENGPFDTQVLFVFHSRPGEDGLEQYEGRASHDADGVWYPGNFIEEDAEPLDTPPVTVDGNRIHGGPLTLEQTWPNEGGEFVVVDSWDLTVPDETWSEC